MKGSLCISSVVGAFLYANSEYRAKRGTGAYHSILPFTQLSCPLCYGCYMQIAAVTMGNTSLITSLPQGRLSRPYFLQAGNAEGPKTNR